MTIPILDITGNLAFDYFFCLVFFVSLPSIGVSQLLKLFR